MTNIAAVAWYATGRFYSDTTKGTLRDVGYFVHIDGVGPLFESDDDVSESNARITFAAEPFKSPSIMNGSLSIGIDLRGAFRIFLRDVGGASFDNPGTFAKGKCIATFERVSIVPTTNVAITATQSLLNNVFTARLVSSEPFEFNGARHDFRDLVGYGVTQWGTAATAASDTSGVPFVGSAVRVGN